MRRGLLTEDEAREEAARRGEPRLPGCNRRMPFRNTYLPTGKSSILYGWFADKADYRKALESSNRMGGPWLKEAVSEATGE